MRRRGDRGHDRRLVWQFAGGDHRGVKSVARPRRRSRSGRRHVAIARCRCSLRPSLRPSRRKPSSTSVSPRRARSPPLSVSLDISPGGIGSTTPAQTAIRTHRLKCAGSGHSNATQVNGCGTGNKRPRTPSGWQSATLMTLLRHARSAATNSGVPAVCSGACPRRRPLPPDGSSAGCPGVPGRWFGR
jgi:hypothetical protein